MPLGAVAWTVRDLGLETAQLKGTSQSHSQVVCVQEVHVSMPPGHQSLTLVCSLTVMLISAVCFVITLWTVSCAEPGNPLITLVTTAGSFTEGPSKATTFSFAVVSLVRSYLCSCSKCKGIYNDPVFKVTDNANPVVKQLQLQ